MNRVIIVIALIVVVGVVFLIMRKPETSVAPTSNATNTSTNVGNASATNGNSNASLEAVEFSPPTKSAHYVSNTPAHGSTLTAPPKQVTINFNFDLAAPSSISVKIGGTEYGTGDTTIAPDKRSMSRSVDPSAPDGTYTVNYTACWPDTSCHNGNFQFAVDRK